RPETPRLRARPRPTPRGATRSWRAPLHRRLLCRHALCRCGRLLFLTQAIDDAARLYHAGVGVDVGLWRIGDEIEVYLLRLEHRHVLEERGADLVGDLVGGLAIVDVEVVRLAPEVMAGGFRLRRDGVEVAHGDAADPVALRRAGAGRRRAHVE